MRQQFDLDRCECEGELRVSRRGLSIVNQKIRQPKMQNIASRLTRRSAVRSFDCSEQQPDFRIL